MTIHKFTRTIHNLAILALAVPMCLAIAPLSVRAAVKPSDAYGANGAWQVTWSELQVEPGQMVSAQFRGLDFAPENLRFWLNGEPVKVRFDVVETGGQVDTLADDLVVAQQFIPILEPGKYEIALGNEDVILARPQLLTVALGEPKRDSEQIAETLAVGFRLIARDIAAVSRPGKGGFNYYSERAFRSSTAENLHNRLETLIEVLPGVIREEYAALPGEYAAGIQAMLVNMQIVPALEELLEQRAPGKVSWTEANRRYLLYVEMNTLVLHEFGQRFELLRWAIDHLPERDPAMLGNTLRELASLWDLFKETKEDLLAYLEEVGFGDDGDDPRDTPPPIIFGEEIDKEDSCRVKIQCHWGAARGPITGWISKALVGQRHCAFYTRIDSEGQPMLGHHIQGSLFTVRIETKIFSSDAGFLELQSDYWDHWDSYSAPIDSCALATCLRGMVNEFDAIRERPYKAFADGKHFTTAVHSNSSSFIGALVDSCTVPSPTPTLGNSSNRPLVRRDYKEGFAGWHYWERAKPPAEFWKQVSSAKTPPTIHPYSPNWLIQLQYKLWWNT